MAVFCGVCATRLSDAGENYGSFSVDESFQGWDVNEITKHSQIQDTCASCALALRRAIATTAIQIAAENQTRVETLRTQVRQWAIEADKARKEKAEFERAWWEQRNKQSTSAPVACSEPCEPDLAAPCYPTCKWSK